MNISPVRILLEAVHLNKVHAQVTQPFVHVVILGAVLAVLTKADNLRTRLEIHAFEIFPKRLHLKISGHARQPPVANHVVLPLVDVLEAEELTLAAFQLTDLARGKTIKAFLHS